MRIDGFDNIAIPTHISFSPATETLGKRESLREKISGILAGMGFREMLNNSITNSTFYGESELKHAVKMMNSLSAELDMLRPSMLETGLQSIAHNLNRKNNNLHLFEFGKLMQLRQPVNTRNKTTWPCSSQAKKQMKPGNKNRRLPTFTI